MRKTTAGILGFLIFTVGLSGTAIAGGGGGGNPAFVVNADFDGDGTTDVGVYESTTGNWFIEESTDGSRIVGGFGGP